MFQDTRSNGQGNSVTLTINSVVNGQSQLILFKHNRVIFHFSFVEPPTSVVIQKGYNRVYFYPVGTTEMTVDITHLMTFPNPNYHTLQVFCNYVNTPTIKWDPLRIVAALNAKSYPFRAPVTLYKQMPNDSDIIELYSPFDGVIQSGTDSQPILQGLNTVDITDVGDRFYITNQFITTFDYTFDYTFQQDHTAYLCEVDRVCGMNNKAVVINYTNANGENSYLLGYSTEVENKFDGDNYQSNEITIYNKQTKLHLTDHSQEMTVVIPNVTYLAYPSDIMLNDVVELTYQGRVYKASPIADAVSYTDDYQDYELKFKIL